jgi:ankyrin repeat protein
MKPFRSLRKPRHWLPLLGAFVLATAWMMSPSLRLAVRERLPGSIAHAQLVDAHRYDSEWFDAARAGRIDILAALLDAGYPIDAQTSSGYSATILAAYDDQPAALNYLLERGANACLGDNNGNTALMGALYKGEPGIARRLLKTTCPIDQANHAGETALAFAAMFGRLGMVKDLVDHGADPGHRDREGATPYEVVEKQGNAEAMRVLRNLAP